MCCHITYLIYNFVGILTGNEMSIAPTQVTLYDKPHQFEPLVPRLDLTELVQRTANRPSSERGSRRRLEGIRSHGMPDPETSEFFAVDTPDTFPVVTR